MLLRAFVATLGMLGLSLCLELDLHSQTLDPEFEVASIRPVNPRDPIPAGHVEDLLQTSASSERIIEFRDILRAVLARAYGVNIDQVSGPEWLAELRYDFRVKVPSGTTSEVGKIMLQNLLKERFKIVLHHDSKSFPVYELSVAKTGLKMKSAAAPDAPPAPFLGPDLAVNRDGFPVLPPGESGVVSKATNGINRQTFRGMPVSTLIRMLQPQLGTMEGVGRYTPGRIIDKTGLTGKYDFNLEFSGNTFVGGGLLPPSSIDTLDVGSGGPDIFQALRTQLGLDLVKTASSLDILVIDHADKTPTEN
ncbi:MAG TPA: TIGR03435 family protein [Bryobacteraceae bacterium]|jgi:uncharacterized protein (TIGR03435 family)